MIKREKFASQADIDVLAKMRDRAKCEGRQFQSVLEDAMLGYLAGYDEPASDPKHMNEEMNRALAELAGDVSDSLKLFKRRILASE